MIEALCLEMLKPYHQGFIPTYMLRLEIDGDSKHCSIQQNFWQHTHSCILQKKFYIEKLMKWLWFCSSFIRHQHEAPNTKAGL